MAKNNTMGTTSCANALLAALPPPDFSRVERHLQTVTLEENQQLAGGRRAISYAYFPTQALVSHLCSTPSGESIEVAMTGPDGVVGFDFAQAPLWEPGPAVVQRAGEALRLPHSVMREEFARGEFMQLLVLRYGALLMAQMAQTALCNRLHRVDQQLCRWILMSVDRCGPGRMSITQQQLAAMLGVRREGVSAAVGRLQASGALRWGRGRLDVIDRSDLERNCCECYRTLKASASRMYELTPSVA
ncbi:MAG: Crp/Fnr family transcriptional regulator [Ramlibacter sp.]|nr:Crp/Fnr family transcriptional regulator [Ramlibacter sp.]